MRVKQPQLQWVWQLELPSLLDKRPLFSENNSWITTSIHYFYKLWKNDSKESEDDHEEDDGEEEGRDGPVEELGVEGEIIDDTLDIPMDGTPGQAQTAPKALIAQ